MQSFFAVTVEFEADGGAYKLAVGLAGWRLGLWADSGACGLTVGPAVGLTVGLAG